MPHINAKDFPNRKEKLLEAVKHHINLVYGLTDDSTVVLDADTASFIGRDSVKIESGEILNG